MSYRNPRFEDFWTFPAAAAVLLSSIYLAASQVYYAFIATIHALRSFLAAVDG